MSIDTATDQTSYTVEITPDQDAESPRDWTPASTMICFHNRHILGDQHDLDPTMFSGWNGLRTEIERDRSAKVIVPIGMIDHSGISLYVGAGPHASDAQGWDSGQVGFAFMTEQQILKEFDADTITDDLIEQATRLIHGEIETYSQYLRGDVWSVVISDETGQVVDSVGGVYGHEYAEQEAALMMKDLA